MIGHTHYGSMPIPGYASPEKFEENCKNLEAKLNSAVGQLVLIVENSVRSHGCGESFKNIDTNERMGVLTSVPNLPFKKGIAETFSPYLILPMEKHVDDLKLKKGSIDISVCGSLSQFLLGKDASYKIGEDGCFSSAWKISKPSFLLEVGKDVETYFRIHNVMPRYPGKNLQEVAELLKNKPGSDARIDTSYVQAMDLLGLEEKVPEDFRKMHDTEIYAKRKDLLKKLEEEIGRDPKNEREIKNLLSCAIDLEMHAIDLILEEEPGKTLEVSKYILGLCDKYMEGNELRQKAEKKRIERLRQQLILQR